MEPLKIQFNRSDLLRELSLITPIVEKSTKFPILTHCLLDARVGPGSAQISGSDLDISIKSSCPAVVDSPGAIAVPARDLTDMVRSLPEDSVVEIFSDNMEHVTVRSGRFRSKLVALGQETFPDIPSYKGNGVSIPSSLFRRMVQLTQFATTQEQHNRFVLSGVQFTLSPHRMRMVGTDAHRLCICEADQELEGCEHESKLLIPKKALNHLDKILADECTCFEFAADDNNLYFFMGARTMVCRILSGDYPNVDMVMRHNLDGKVLIGTDQLKYTLNRVNVMADEISRKVVFFLEDGMLRVRTQNINKGEAEDEFELDYHDLPTELIFNSHYLMEYLNAVGTGGTFMEFLPGPSRENTSVVFRPAEEVDYRYRYTVMPLSMKKT